MAILGLDSGTNFGWSLRFSTGGHFSGTWKFTPKKNEHPGMRWLKVRNNILVAIADSPEPVTLLAYELVMRHSAVIAAQVYGGMKATIELISHEKKIELLPIPVGTVKKFATGSGCAQKEQMISAAKTKWRDYQSNDDNEADARWIAECAYQQMEGFLL